MSDEEYSSEEEIDEVEEVTDLSNRCVVLRRWIKRSCRSFVRHSLLVSAQNSFVKFLPL